MPQRIVKRTKIAEWTGIIALVVALASGFTLYELQQRNHRALCAIKHVEEVQRNNSVKLLKQHPNLKKIDIGPITYTRQDIKDIVKQENKQIAALHIHC